MNDQNLLFYHQIGTPNTLSLHTIQILELSGALVLLKYIDKPQYKFSNFFKKNNLLSNRNWFLSSALGFGFLALLIFLTSQLPDLLYGSKLRCIPSQRNRFKSFCNREEEEVTPLSRGFSALQEDGSP